MVLMLHLFKLVICISFVTVNMLFKATSSSCTDCGGRNMTCVDGLCLPRCVNVTSSGDCLQCRDSRFYGKQCQTVCPHTCLNSSCQMNNSRVECTEGCVAGKKGDRCGVDCSTSCTLCERYGDSCVGPCTYPQYYGDYCNKSCPRGCRDRCDKDTGECDSCKSGLIGPICTIICSSVCRDVCDIDTDKCDSCVKGYKGRYCNETCPPNCTLCERFGDSCFQCVDGRKGNQCRKLCDPNCMACLQHEDLCTGPCETTRECNSTCSRLNLETGKCTLCRDSRFYGDKCGMPCDINCRDGCDIDSGQCDGCVDGYRGRFCNETCPSTCTGCEQFHDKCLQCVDGRKGAHCEKTCDPSCVSCLQYGDLCTGQCKTNGCISTCMKVKSGKCTLCRDFTYHGNRCEKLCPDNCRGGCDRVTGECDICDGPNCTDDVTSRITVGVVGVVVSIGLVLLVAVLLKRRQGRQRSLRQPRQASNQGQAGFSNSSDQSDRSQYMVTKYWEIDDKDLDADAISDSVLLDQHFGSTAPLQQRAITPPKCPSMNQGETDSTGPKETDISSKHSNLQSDVDSLMENILYQSAETGAASAEPSAYVMTSGGIRFQTIDGRPSQAEQTKEGGSEWSVTSEDLILARKTESMILWHQNADFSNVYVRYISPNVSDHSCE